MKRTIILTLLVLCSAAMADAETYKWTDGQGVVSFTDNPALIPHRYRSKALKMKDKPTAREQEEKTLQYELTTPPDVTTDESVKPTPAPPSMKQPIPEPLGDQPKPTPPGMKQPMPAPLGDQPSPTPPGMKQPIPAPTGVQPKATPLGMEQPAPAR